MRILMILAMCQMALAEDRMRRETVALTILAEARGEGEGGMYRVACVIQQRVIQRKIPADRVCREEGQFARGKRELFKSKSAPYALKLADHLIREHKFDREIVGFADHFCGISCFPYWAKGLSPVATYGGHKFFKLNE
jgi:spore germination cell wall hydrolase CwlJ-like protein